jgi:uncharacterized protein YfaS (alpha-2-macroglobulin family)
VTLPIDRPRVIDNRLVLEKTLGKGGTWSGDLGVSADVLRDESSLTVTIDRTGVGDLAPGLRSLVEYPYGCLEQTMSRVVPLMAAKDLANTLDDPSLKGTKANSFIKAGVAKVIRHQQGDGQFSLWPQSQTYPHLTAYALWGLTVAQQSGEEIPAQVFDNGIRGLQGWSTKSGIKPDGDGAVMAMGAYVMALRGKPDANLNARLYALRSGLPRWGQAFLLRAMHKAKADPAQIAELKKSIEAGIVVESGRALVREGTAKNPSYEYHYMNSDIRASAMTLAALLEVDPQSKLIDPLAAGIKHGRNGKGDWISTQETLWSLVALADYGRRATGGETNVTVKVGGKQVSAKKIKGAEIATVKLPFKTGDVVTVKLVVKADAAQKWVAMVDPIPAGFEVLNPKLASGGTAQPGKPAPQQPSQDPWAKRWGYVQWDHQELRDDRVLWFADNLYGGHYELTYQARATIDGSFSAMPATIEAMYQPHVRGRSTPAKITVTK